MSKVYFRCDDFAPSLGVCYVDPDKPGGFAAMMVESMERSFNRVVSEKAPGWKWLRTYKGLDVSESYCRHRSSDGRYSAELEITVAKSGQRLNLMPEDVEGRIKLYSTEKGYAKRVRCKPDPELLKQINELVADLESVADPWATMDSLALDF